jgi:hypothetical protein
MPTMPFNSMPSDASSMLEAALPCIASADDQRWRECW